MSLEKERERESLVYKWIQLKTGNTEVIIKKEKCVRTCVKNAWKERCVRIEHGAGGTPGVPDFFISISPRVWIECKALTKFPDVSFDILGKHQKKFMPTLLDSNDLVCVLIGRVGTNLLRLYLALGMQADQLRWSELSSEEFDTTTDVQDILYSLMKEARMVNHELSLFNQ